MVAHIAALLRHERPARGAHRRHHQHQHEASHSSDTKSRLTRIRSGLIFKFAMPPPASQPRRQIAFAWRGERLLAANHAAVGGPLACERLPLRHPRHAERGDASLWLSATDRVRAAAAARRRARPRRVVRRRRGRRRRLVRARVARPTRASCCCRRSVGTRFSPFEQILAAAAEAGDAAAPGLATLAARLGGARRRARGAVRRARPRRRLVLHRLSKPKALAWLASRVARAGVPRRAARAAVRAAAADGYAGRGAAGGAAGGAAQPAASSRRPRPRPPTAAQRTAAAPNADADGAPDEAAVRAQRSSALQLVCEYLTDEWAEALLAEYGLTFPAGPLGLGRRGRRRARQGGGRRGRRHAARVRARGRGAGPPHRARPAA